MDHLLYVFTAKEFLTFGKPSMSSTSPYISFVAASRNDDHGGQLIPRMQAFIRSLQYQCRRVELPCELVLVEWNPPPGAPSLQEIISTWPQDPMLPIRIITVPASLHHRFDRARLLPLHQMIAKNTGIRRARGRFIACTNIDLIFSDALFNRLGGRSLKEGFFYRCIRCDVPSGLAQVNDAAALEREASRQVIRRWGKDPDFPGLKVISAPSFLYRSARWRFLYPALAATKRLLMGRDRYRIACLDKEACGDFTLMTARDWMDIQGYAEWPCFPLHLDSLALIAALALGKRQEILPVEACTYHIEHTREWALPDAGKRTEFNRSMGVLNWEEIEEAGLRMLRENRGYGDQAEDWGLKAEVLPEYSL